VRRPLAVFGLAYFLAMLAATRLPATWLLPVVIAVAVLFGLALVFLRKRAHGLAPLLLAACLAAGLLRLGYDAVFVQPMALLDDTRQTATARVVAVEPGYGGDTVHATLQVLALDDDTLPTGFSVEVKGIAQVDLGDVIAIPLRFYAFGNTSTQRYNYGKGHMIAASATGAGQKLGTSDTPLTLVRRLQYAAGANILQRLPTRLASVMAAMAVGDSRFLTDETKEGYRMAGLSHMLVVSGLHLSILCGYLFIFSRRVFHRRRAAAAVCLGFVLLFMAFTGFSPSIVRSGFVYIFVYLAELFRRKSDVYTSMAIAAIVLVTQNPYACTDVGLLLSFTATFGALASGQLAQRLGLTHRERPLVLAGSKAGQLARRAGRGLLLAALTPLCVTVATLPVLVWAGIGLSLLSLPMNILCVPLLSPIVLCGLLMALPPALPVIGLLGVPASLVGGALLALLEWLTALCAGAAWAWIPLGGAFGLVVILVLYALVFAAVKTRRRRLFAAAAVLMLPLAFALSTALSAGVVQVHVATGGASPSLVVTSGGQAVVLYRGRQTAYAVTRILRQTRTGDCALLIDMRRTAESTEYEALYAPRQIVVVEEDLVSGNVYHPFEPVEVSIIRQGDGSIACVDIAGYKIGLVAGSANLEHYSRLNLMLAGAGTVRGDYDALLATGAVPEWMSSDAQLIQADGDAQLWIRPGTSILWKEVSDGFGE